MRVIAALTIAGWVLAGTATAGYYHRDLDGVLWSIVPTHSGRTWTRMAFHPVGAAKTAARYGFRVVEEVETK
jgi:hypothetical protein